MSQNHDPYMISRNDLPQISFHDLDSSSAVILYGTGDALLPIFSPSLDQSTISHNDYPSSLNNINTANALLFNNNSRKFSQDDARSISLDQTINIMSADFESSRMVANEMVIDRINDDTKKEITSSKRVFECKDCDRVFIRRPSLIIHQRIHNAKSPYQCMLCGRLFRQKSNANRHIETHKVFPKFCQQKANTGGQSQKPIISECKSKKQMHEYNSCMVAYQCSYCENQFDCARCLKSHAITIHCDIRVFACPAEICQVESADLSEIVKHVRDMHKSDYIYKCYLCDESFRSLTSIEVHFLSHRLKKRLNVTRNRIKKNEQISCPICPKKYSTLYEWKKHYFATHWVSREKWECVECSKRFSYRITYKLHMERHNPGNLKPVICEKCSKIFSRLDAMKRHLFSRHNDTNANMSLTIAYKCSFHGCMKIYKRRDSLRDHMKCHCQTNNEHSNAFMCSECGKSYCRQRALRAHISAKHENKHKFRCVKCGKGYDRSPLFEKHVYRCSKSIKSKDYSIYIIKSCHCKCMF